MKSSAMPISACRASSRARICAWMVTSRAVVGSSAISSLRPAGERHGDHRPLPLPARELVRVGVDPPLRLRECRSWRAARSPAPRAWARPSAACRAQHLADLRADRVQRIERGHRLLEDHRDLAAADRAQLAVPRPAAGRAPAKRIAAGRLGAVDQAEDRQRGDRLARARFADEGEFLAGGDLRTRHRRPPAWRRSARSGARSRAARSGARLRRRRQQRLAGPAARSASLRPGEAQSVSSSPRSRVIEAPWAPPWLQA